MEGEQQSTVDHLAVSVPLHRISKHLGRLGGAKGRGGGGYIDNSPVGVDDSLEAPPLAQPALKVTLSRRRQHRSFPQLEECVVLEPGVEQLHQVCCRGD